MQEEPAHIAICGVVLIITDTMSAISNCISISQDQLLRAMLTTLVVTADLMWQALQEQMMELMAALSTTASQWP